MNEDKAKIYDFREDKTTMEIDIAEYPTDMAYLEFEEELTEKKVKFIEREIRSSYEYRQYISYLKNELDLTRCTLLPNIDSDELSVSLEFHHYPINLYEITETIGKKLIDEANGGKVSCLDIAEEVMAEHYKNKIGLVPLTGTLHKMAHNRAIIIPTENVYGDYKSFISENAQYLSSDVVDRVAELEISTNSDDAKNYNNMKLKKNIINYDISYYREDSDDE